GGRRAADATARLYGLPRRCRGKARSHARPRRPGCSAVVHAGRLGPASRLRRRARPARPAGRPTLPLPCSYRPQPMAWTVYLVVVYSLITTENLSPGLRPINALPSGDSSETLGISPSNTPASTGDTTCT